MKWAPPSTWDLSYSWVEVALLILLLLFACKDSPEANRTKPAPNGGAPTVVEELPQPASIEPGELPEEVSVVLSGEEAHAAMVSQLDLLLSVELAEIEAVVFEMLQERSPGCPEQMEIYEEEFSTVITFFSYGCSTPSGARFNGDFQYDTYTIRQDGFEESEVAWYGGDSVIQAADGRLLILSGAFGGGSYHEQGYTYNYLYAEGVIETSSGLSADPLLSGELSGNFYAGIEASGSYRSVSFEGAAGAERGGLTSMSSESFSLRRGCEPKGTLLVREEAGAWQSLAFGEEDEECDGCALAGEVGGDMAPYCFELNPLNDLLNWESVPW